MRNPDDGWDGSASGSTFSRIVGGVLAPLVLGGFGLHACWVGHAVLVGKYGEKLELSGPDALVFGAALLAAATFLHFHFVWATVERLYVWAGVGKALSLLALIGGLGYVAWHVVTG